MGDPNRETSSPRARTSTTTSLHSSSSVPVGAGWDTRTNPHVPESESESAVSTSKAKGQPIKENEYSSRARDLLKKVRGVRDGSNKSASFFDPEEEDPSTKRRLKASRNAASKVAAFGAGNPSQVRKDLKDGNPNAESGEKGREAVEEVGKSNGKGKGKQREPIPILEEARTTDLTCKTSRNSNQDSDLSTQAAESSVDQHPQAQIGLESRFTNPSSNSTSPPATPPPPPSKRKRGGSSAEGSFKLKTGGKARGKQKEKTKPLTEGQVMGIDDSEGTPPPLARDFPWPEHFLQLERTFKAVNTVYAFCQARKHMATTFDTMKSSVEGLIKRELSIFDLAQIKSLCPDLIKLAYVDQDSLDVTLDGNRSDSFEKSKDSYDPDQNLYRKKGKRDHNLYRKKGKRGEPKVDVYEQAMAAMESGKGLHLPGRRDFGPDGAFNPDQQAANGMIGGFKSSSSSSSGGGWRDDSDALGGMQEDESRDNLLNETDPESLLPSAEIKEAAGSERRQSDYVLLFEFNDGTVQGGPKATARGANRARMRRGPNRNEKKPKNLLSGTPSTASMQKLVSKRNFKFEQAVIELLLACAAKDADPIELLVDAADNHVPLNPQASRPIEESPQKKRIKLQHLMKHPEDRPAISEIIEEMKLQPWWKEQIVPGGRRTVESREPKYSELNFLLSQEMVNALWMTSEIEQFYSHQAEALNALNEGSNVIVSTSTSSGKSLIYQIPVLRALESDSSSTALYIFPTKALAQDQKRSLQNLLNAHEGLEDTFVATYDGDTDKDLRRGIRDKASVIFTNPDMLHQSLLPSEDAWRRFLLGLRFVVVDELHTYNGLFGTHVSFIMRRLRRLCAALGNSQIQFVSCSATVLNPAEHMRTLFGVENVQVITEDGSPSGQKEWVIYNPPFIDEDDKAQGRVSAYAEVSRVFRHLIERGVRTIIFTKVRRTCEMVMRQVKDDLLLDNRHDVIDKVMSYRSGYSPQDRRKIETDMFKGSLLGIVATSALELGIDIGSLDAVIMLGFPYSISSLRQQAGRAGRRQKDSLAVLVGDPFPMDQFYMANPDEVFNQPDAALAVDLSNDFILEAHLQCAAQEMPIHPSDDLVYFGDSLGELCQTRLEADGDGFYHCRSELRPNPSKGVAIRGARQDSYAYIDDTPGRRLGPKVMEEVEIERAIFEAFEGAVFMHQGSSYICHEISHERRIARMVQADVNFHTRPRDHTDTDAVETYRIRSLSNSEARAYFGKVTITSHIYGYYKVDKRANILDQVEMNTPPFIRNTRGCWLDVPLWIIEALTSKTINAAAAIHAAEHALLSLTPIFVVSASGEVRTECKVADREYSNKQSSRKRPARLIFYDMPGQNGGICHKAFEHLDGILRIALAVIENCTCIDGCPSCVTSSTCAHANVVTSKVGAKAVLRALCGRKEIFDPDLPQQNEIGKAADSLEKSGLVQAEPVDGSQACQVESIQEFIPSSLQRVIEEKISSTQVKFTQNPRTHGPMVYEETQE